LQEIPNVSLDATTAGAKIKPAAVGESRNKYSRGANRGGCVRAQAEKHRGDSAANNTRD
jgi:hypothetical protein